MQYFSILKKYVYKHIYLSKFSDFLLDDVNCDGSESSLYECESRPWGDHDCDAGEAAGVYCAIRLTGNPGDAQMDTINGPEVVLTDTVDDSPDVKSTEMQSGPMVPRVQEEHVIPTETVQKVAPRDGLTSKWINDVII